MTKLRLLIIVFLLIIVGWLGYLNIKPVRIYTKDFVGLKSPISEAKDITGAEVLPQNIDGVEKKVLVMEKDRLYFNVFLNDVFVSARFKIKFRNEKQPEFSLRVPVHQGVSDAVKYYLEEKELDKLKKKSDWIAIEDNGALVLQRRSNKNAIFASVKEFLEKLPQNNIKPIAQAGDFTFPYDIDISKTNLVRLEKITDIEKFDYLIARYQPWTEDRSWKINEYEVGIPESFRRKNVFFPFYLEAPNLENEKNKIIIDSIEITLKKPRAIKNSTVIKIK